MKRIPASLGQFYSPRNLEVRSRKPLAMKSYKLIKDTILFPKMGKNPSHSEMKNVLKLLVAFFFVFFQQTKNNLSILQMAELSPKIIYE